MLRPSSTINAATTAASEGLACALETDVPDVVRVGRGSVLYLAGWCFHNTQRIRHLEVAICGRLYPVLAHSILRPDVWQQMNETDPLGHSLKSGFWALLPLLPETRTGPLIISLRATLRDLSIEQRVLAQTSIAAERDNGLRTGEPQLRQDTHPLVAICMTTFNPPLDLFRRQIKSIVDQTYEHWVCMISDDGSSLEAATEMERVIAPDPRFVLVRSAERLGFYHNFERSLQLAPSTARFIALSDQDDYWHPDKLAVLLERFDDRALLIYSDMRVVDRQGNVISPTNWTVRRNNHTDLSSLLLANCVTGAASMFRRELLNYIQPFPERIGDLYHDHWLGCMALALGPIRYIPDTLWDYVQHGSNVIGHDTPPRASLATLIYRVFKGMMTADGRMRARQIYFEKVLKVEALACTLLMRGGDRVRQEERHALHRLATLEGSWLGWVWLAMSGLKDWNQKGPTLGAEYFLLQGLVWRFYVTVRSRVARRRRQDSKREHGARNSLSC
jgi:glycosyltransferase involved in cell wall biosynthesis